MKKNVVASFILASVVALSLAGCGSSESSSAPAADSSASQAASSSDSASGAQEITLNAKNFEFDQKEIHVKKGDKVKLTLANSEGMHGIEIPDFNVNIQGDGSAEFTADKAGEFEFKCSVMCGAGHDTMTGKLIVEE
ncbi:cupredoxin domain-containing protein [Brevibacillus fulvus]|uniref:Cytochrome c oxidase subunit 2 n=1 Tax=Brevibacillus fulvus TaxID=1125967 RepID=A0A938XX30_9BACL|nr:cupredoxin domain-containing protein [Brevibacillus fulvus]MBM7589243.1 cytochrome c oxidase subunit 2 [Brevibacillus fulvus]